MQQIFNWKYLILLLAIIIAAVSLYKINEIVKVMEQEEHQKMQMHINALKVILEESDQSFSGSSNAGFLLASKIIAENKTIPIIVTDENNNITTTANIDTLKIKKNPEFLQSKLKEYRELHGKIILDDGYNVSNYYYGDSAILSNLKNYPLIAMFLITVFIVILFIALRNAQMNIQNQVWVGMSKETAHQLGTPLSSVVAWMELLKENEANQPFIQEMEKDVERLQLVADRFSKIGSIPQLKEELLITRLQKMVDYMQKRAPLKVDIVLQHEEPEVEILLVGPLFDWVIENLIRNALDAMEGEGKICIQVKNEPRTVTIDVSDTGKGMSHNKFKKVFQPGYSTKLRGWGLGLSLAKRIIEKYHNGSIFVKQSEINKGTTFRIILRR